jgi:lipid-A-disaccharide synthase
VAHPGRVALSAGTPASQRPVIFLSAGEPSGDLHGAALARAIRRRIPDARLIGLGGPRMAAEGTELLAGLDELAVMGLAEVLKHLPYFIRLRRRVFETLARERVDLVVPIDYPGFNLRLAHHARELGVPVLYFIAPQVWAWHASRAKTLARDTDRIAVILPFEEEFLREAGGNASFVGHPLLDAATPAGPRAEWAARLGLDAERPVLALFPGSRRQEVERHLELFSAAAAEVVRSRSEVQPVIAAAPGLDRSLFAGAAWPLADDTGALLRHATAALVKSGTTTLEAAISGTPFAVVYRMNRLTFQIARRLVRVPHIALANLVAGERLAPEFVQDDAQPDRLAAALLDLLDPDSPTRIRMVTGFERIRDLLGQGGAADRVAEMAVELLQGRPAS